MCDFPHYGSRKYIISGIEYKHICPGVYRCSLCKSKICINSGFWINLGSSFEWYYCYDCLKQCKKDKDYKRYY